MAEIVMPQLGETVTEGTITKWFKQIGDQVAQDEVLFEVSTDKVDSEVPSTSAGVLTEIRVQEGETVDVGTVLAVIGDSAPSDGGGGGGAEAEAPAEPAPAAEAAPEPASSNGDGALADEAATQEAALEEASAEQPQPPSERGAPAPEPAPAAPAEQPAAAEQAAPPAGDGGGGDGRLLSPIVRRLVKEHDLDVDQIQGTGPDGRITRDDVERAIDSGAAAKATAPSPAPAAEAPPAAPSAPAPTAPAPAAPAAAPSRPRAPLPAPVVGRGDTTVPLNRIRLLTGQHMVGSKQISPHVLTAVEVDFEGVDRVRRAVREQWRAEEGFSLTYLPFVARAVADALRKFPHPTPRWATAS